MTSLQEAIKEKYGKAATGARNSCCGGSVRRSDYFEPLQRQRNRRRSPAGAVQASLGCGNPTAMIDLKAG